MKFDSLHPSSATNWLGNSLSPKSEKKQEGRISLFAQGIFKRVETASKGLSDLRHRFAKNIKRSSPNIEPFEENADNSETRPPKKPKRSNILPQTLLCEASKRQLVLPLPASSASSLVVPLTKKETQKNIALQEAICRNFSLRPEKDALEIDSLSALLLPFIREQTDPDVLNNLCTFFAKTEKSDRASFIEDLKKISKHNAGYLIDEEAFGLMRELSFLQTPSRQMLTTHMAKILEVVKNGSKIECEERSYLLSRLLSLPEEQIPFFVKKVESLAQAFPQNPLLVSSDRRENYELFYPSLAIKIQKGKIPKRNQASYFKSSGSPRKA